jgi:hypothetical protein
VNKTSEGGERLTIGWVVTPERSSGCALERSFVGDCVREATHTACLEDPVVIVGLSPR